MATYPGTVKVFDNKNDQIDTVFAADVNSLQGEVVAIQSVLGLSPQGSAASVAARLDALTGTGVTLVGDQTIGGNKTFTGATVFTGTARAENTGELTSLAATTNPWQVGSYALNNIAMDRQRIQARNNGAVADLLLQPYGGTAYVGAGKIWTDTTDGSGSGMDADTVDGLHSAAFATSGHKHAANFVQLRKTVPQSIPYNTWTTVVWNFVDVHYHESDPANLTLMYTLGDGRLMTPPPVGPALYFGSARVNFNQNKTGNRGLRFVDQSGAIIDESIEESDKSAHDFVTLAGMYYFAGISNGSIVVKVWHTAKNSSGDPISLSVQAHTSQSPFNVTWAPIMRALA